MNSSSIIAIILIIIIYVWYIVIIKRKNQVLESLSDIDVQLTKRHDLIPNILEIAKKFMDHEKSLITEVTALRSNLKTNYQHDNKEEVEKYFDFSNELAAKMSSLLLQVENYPNLKSDQTMLQAQVTYNEVEEHISAARRFYNASVTELNSIIQIFPGNLIAKLAKAEIMPFYKSNETRQPIDAGQILK